MEKDDVNSTGLHYFKKWWVSLLLLPFIWFSIDQAYLTLRFNIFFAITYNFPFPVNIIHIFLDNFLLTVHEAGHTFFSLFGWPMLTILGGSLLQVAIPLLILAYCWFNRLKAGIQLSLYLVGFSFLQVAFYTADAGGRQLPLLGGLPKEAHDWYNLLGRWNALGQDHAIALVFCAVAGAFYLAALLLPAFFKSYKPVNLDLNL